MQKMITNFHGEFAFLSNFYPVDIIHEGILYHSTEAAYQASKTTDERMKQRIAEMEPGEAKRAGRKVNIRIDFEEQKDAIMLELLRKKFKRGTDLAKMLDATGDVPLIEGNTWHDQYWGVCTCPNCGGTGRNILGQLLMIVRAENRIPVISHELKDYANGAGCP